MEAVYKIKDENPKIQANFISKLFFGWMIRLCYKGTQKTLEVIDLYKPLSCDRSEELTNALEENWNQEISKSKARIDSSPSLTRAIIKSFYKKYMFFGILLFINLVLVKSFQPFVLAQFISLFSDNPLEPSQMYIFGSILIVQAIVYSILVNQIEFGLASIGMRVRIAVSSLIYRKLLKLNKKSLGETSAGHVVNLLSNDVNRFDFVTLALHYLWIVPPQVVLVTYLIWREMGVSTLAGVLFMLGLTLPVQGHLAKLTSRFRLRTAQRTDHRVKLMNEIISGIQIIKMYAWEKPFELIVKLARKHEINVITKSSYLRGVFLSCIVFIERTTLFLTVTCYVLLGNSITAEKVFSIAQYFNLLQLALAIYFPMSITFGAESLVSVKRLRDFLLLEEKSVSTVEFKSNEGVRFTNVTSAWTNERTTLDSLNFSISCGCLCVIVGPVGSGKTSLLQMLLGELPVVKGSIGIGGSTSYASQEPWLFASTIRNNILFGRKYNKARYRQIVNVCALKKDFEQFPQSDKTVVGEKGVSLSGGQRARVNLARSVYREADIYLLDDPLSAVDAHVSKHLFEECILDYLNDKTRILVTHQLQYLKKADYIVVINEGKIEAQGTFDYLLQNNIDFTKLLPSDNQEHAEKEGVIQRTKKMSISSHKSITSEQSEVREEIENMEEINYSNSSPFRDYAKAAGGTCACLSILALLILAQTTCNASDIWVTVWTEAESKCGENCTLNREQYMIIYSIIIVLAIVLTLSRSIAFFKMAMNASKNLHNYMFHTLLQAPMRFFDSSPSGRILNRFSKDMGAIDEFLPRILIEAMQILLVMSGILIMIIIANYYMIIAIVAIGFLFLKLRGWYLASARDVKHLEGITKSNVFSHLNSSFNGISTIRASQAEQILKEEFDLHQDVHTSAWFLTIATRICFGLWLDLLSVIFVAIVILSFILLKQFSEVSGSFVGLAISQSLILTGMLQFGMRQTAEVVNQLTSVDRVMQYTKLENENTKTKTIKSTDAEWPSKGFIEFVDLSLRYTDNDPPVLRNLNLRIVPGERIGIVGRTGAGKSSLIAALFRLAPIEGKILIDSVDILTVPLKDLRSRISIIPQEPVLFSATLRYNLDPFQEFEDSKLWEVLEEVELKESIRDLSIQVTEGGGNFSLGQRQLLCLARAILRNNKILVLDEATANVDQKTDALIQETIRKKFKNCTVLTIAHRLNTIMDSDRVLVMHAGRMVEFNHPHILLQDSDGFLTKLVEETGPAMSQQLKQTAQEFYLLKQQEIM